MAVIVVVDNVATITFNPTEVASLVAEGGIQSVLNGILEQRAKAYRRRLVKRGLANMQVASEVDAVFRAKVITLAEEAAAIVGGE